MVGLLCARLVSGLGVSGTASKLLVAAAQAETAIPQRGGQGPVQCEPFIGKAQLEIAPCILFPRIGYHLMPWFSRRKPLVFQKRISIDVCIVSRPLVTPVYRYIVVSVFRLQRKR